MGGCIEAGDIVLGSEPVVVRSVRTVAEYFPETLEETAYQPEAGQQPLLRADHIPNNSADALRKPTLCNSRLQPFDARRMAVDCHDRTHMGGDRQG